MNETGKRPWIEMTPTVRRRTGLDEETMAYVSRATALLTR